MRIEPLTPEEKPPMDLLLLADPSARLVEQYLRRGECYVARAGEKEPVGAYVLLPTRPDTAELVNVAVDERHQGQGIGKALVRHAVETARRRGYRTVEVGTGNSGVGQLALYQKCGFRIVAVDIDFFVRHYDEPIFENGIPCRDMIRMSQDL
ncbi:GNAT family N-acetyltransferase [Cohnella sp. JJ-181]|uniref:GNAT family N-acetyltransferase n=1 Tax=Cohnella rhizoplanae TaxID=2974897 RepID=UPI0022FF73AD|nr:GNAT family N-acetyltransferase [Cohnella sp. JJ-181]CAI6024582.1 putative N-acetyltransferase YvbK [Cohnella sp. JJ-181]